MKIIKTTITEGGADITLEENEKLKKYRLHKGKWRTRNNVPLSKTQARKVESAFNQFTMDRLGYEVTQEPVKLGLETVAGDYVYFDEAGKAIIGVTHTREGAVMQRKVLRIGGLQDYRNAVMNSDRKYRELVNKAGRTLERLINNYLKNENN